MSNLDAQFADQIGSEVGERELPVPQKKITHPVPFRVNSLTMLQPAVSFSEYNLHCTVQ